MFNDVLNVRDADQKRKRALALVAAKLMANGQRAAGMANLSRPGGGLGRQNAARFRPLSMSGRGMFGAPGQGSPGDFGQAIGRFGLVERQPGASDPGAIPGLGGIDATSTMGGGQGGGPPANGIPGVSEISADPQIQANALNTEYAHQGGQQASVTPSGSVFEGGLPTWDAPAPTGGSTGGYVNYQGTMIPMGLYKALMMDRMG